MRRIAISDAPLRRMLAVLAVPVALATAGLGVASAAPVWRLEQPAPPAGAPFKVALGSPGDLSFRSPSRGLLAVEGNALIPRGLFTWDGRAWTQLAVVCGGSASTTRIAWAGPSEFWVISAPSRPRVGDGLTLCHFKGGQVAASYGTQANAADPFQVMTAAACAGPDDCWFGGGAATDPTGARTGAFRLHWDGQRLTTSYGPQGRGISDLAAAGGRVWQSSYTGPGPGNRGLAENRDPESVPRLLSVLGTDGAFATDPFVPATVAGVPVDGSELLALGASGDDVWSVGGGTVSGPAAPADGIVSRPPLVVRRAPGAGAWQEITPVAAPGTFGAGDRFTDVAPLSGAGAAWATLQAYADRASVNAPARVARIDAATGAVTVARLPASGAGRGSAARIACPSADQCWMATRAGWLFHWSDGAALPVDTDPAFASLITFRPNESAAQFVPDRPPVDDSQLLAPPPVEVQAETPPAATRVKRVKAVVQNVRRPRLVGTTLVLRFRLTRTARVALVARRHGRVVARTPLRRYAKGRVTLRLRLDRRRWPTALKFVIRIPGQSPSTGGGSDQTVTTGGDPNAVTTAHRVR